MPPSMQPQNDFERELQMDHDDERPSSMENNCVYPPEMAINVSLDEGASTPKKRDNSGPIFDESEFAPGTDAP